MLSSLHIRNYILIDSLDISFPEGLVIITGQTGAGKSILLGALGLLAGGKADPGMISEGAESCVVEGEFETPEGLRIIRRVIYSSGRSRSFIDDCPVQVQELSELCSRLVDIHSQHNSLLLTDKQFQLRLLDHFAGNGQALQECAEAWKALNECRQALEASREQLRRATAEQDYNQAQFAELNAAALKEGEVQELEAEQKILANAGQIQEKLALALGRFRPSGQESISESLREARKALEQAGRFMPELIPLAERLESARIELEDIFAEAEDIAERSDASQEHLATVEDRLSLLYRLLGKHSCKSETELMELRDSYGRSLDGREELADRCKELEAQLGELQSRYDAVCGKLGSARAQAAPRLAREVEESLRFLELERAVFAVELAPGAPGPSGKDSVSYRFSADGRVLQDVAKCASGGELSRIMLSLKDVLARFEKLPTMIFDEIDSGVSGSVADKMGTMICRMGKSMQVISITHLPQVAAKGSAHFVVSKEFRQTSGRSVSGIRRVEGEERVQEIARLLSGSSITPEALANAVSLLNEN